MAVTLTHPFPFARVFAAWRWQQKRNVCVTCEACSSDLDQEAGQLLASGHYRAAVALARLALELTVREVHGHHDGKPAVTDLVFRLVDKGLIEKAFANRAANLYSQASRVMHGRACNRGRAIKIVRDTRFVASQLVRSALVGTEGGAA